MRIVPFWLLYLLSDLLCFILYNVAGYRKKVVYENLKKSFPEKSEEERKVIAKKFYRHLSDIMVEGLKGLGMTKKEVVKRYKLTNADEVNRVLASGRNVLLVGGHYGNWEWGALSIGLWFDAPVSIIYKRLTNPYIDKYFRKRRAAWGSNMWPIEKTREAFVKGGKESCVFVLVSDQSASNSKKAYYTMFLNQESGFVHGMEWQSKRYDMPVIYFNVRKIRRGYYEMDFDLMTDDPKSFENGMITKMYAHKLEGIVKEKPEHWLWSHRRWKRSRPEGNPLI
ncbi:MAG: lysophospholipid acyltransferase family protein [Cytophagales bacterium]|nr:lysophospholipid acyltransferase family protein [Cytophagales bacterium]